MKRLIRANSNPVIFEDEYFQFIRKSGVGMKNTPWSGLAVVSKGLANKHVVEIRLNTKSRGIATFDGTPVNYEYKDCYIAHGMRSVSDTLDETAEYIDVLEDALDFAARVNSWLYNNGDIDDHDDEDYDEYTAADLRDYQGR